MLLFLCNRTNISLNGQTLNLSPFITSYAFSPFMALTLYTCGRDTLYEVFLQGEKQDKRRDYRKRCHRQRAAPVRHCARIANERAQRPRYSESIRLGEVQQVVEEVIPRPQECEQRCCHQSRS